MRRLQQLHIEVICQLLAGQVDGGPGPPMHTQQPVMLMIIQNKLAVVFKNLHSTLKDFVVQYAATDRSFHIMGRQPGMPA